jgi:hypothetical protein
VAVQANIHLCAIAYETIKLGYLDKRFRSERNDNGGTGGAQFLYACCGRDHYVAVVKHSGRVSARTIGLIEASRGTQETRRILR